MKCDIVNLKNLAIFSFYNEESEQSRDEARMKYINSWISL